MSPLLCNREKGEKLFAFLTRHLHFFFFFFYYPFLSSPCTSTWLAMPSPCWCNIRWQLQMQCDEMKCTNTDERRLSAGSMNSLLLSSGCVCVCSRGLEEDQLASKRREVPLGKAQGLPSTSSLYVVGFFFLQINPLSLSNFLVITVLLSVEIHFLLLLAVVVRGPNNQVWRPHSRCFLREKLQALFFFFL